MKEFCKLLFWWNVLLTLALTGLAIAYITHDHTKPQINKSINFKPTDDPSVIEIELLTPDELAQTEGNIWH